MCVCVNLGGSDSLEVIYERRSGGNIILCPWNRTPQAPCVNTKGDPKKRL